MTDALSTANNLKSKMLTAVNTLDELAVRLNQLAATANLLRHNDDIGEAGLVFDLMGDRLSEAAALAEAVSKGLMGRDA